MYTYRTSGRADQQGEEDREFLEEEAGVVFARWLKEKSSIPAAEVSYGPPFLGLQLIR
jgi:hypothetical protein